MTLPPPMVMRKDDVASLGPRELRELYLSRIPVAVFLTKDEREDFIAGRCQIREHENVPILDYSKPWER